MSIDFRSILIVSAFINVAFFGLAAFTWQRGRKEVRGSGSWFIGFSCFTVGLGLVALRGRIPDIGSIFLANGIILVGVLFKVFGVLRYLDIPARRLKFGMVVLLLMELPVFLYFLEASPSLPVRMMLQSSMNVIFGSIAAFFLFAKSPGPVRGHSRVAGLFYAAYAAVYCARTVNALSWGGGDRWIDARDPVESAALIAVMVIMAGLAVAEMLLIHGKLEWSLRESGEELVRRNDLLTAEVERRLRAENELISINRELGSTQQEIMITLSEVVEFRSKETALHVARVGAYARTLCEAVGLPGDEAKLIGDAAPMHDIGKIAVPDEVLNKPTGLTSDELELIRTHTTVGYKLLNKSERPLIKMAARIALEHHEQWDGNGYPEGKLGEGISFAGRVVCLCDVYDALSVARPYKEPWELPRILEYICLQRAKMFDPALVDAFFLSLDRILSISERLAETRP